jgi:glycosyltransferase involved in cell wall biosynthesis
MIHSFYSRAQPSGENRVVEDQVDALAGAGHDVLLISQDTDALQSPLYGARTALKVLLGAGHDPSGEILSFAPDIVHVQNLHPNFSTRWLRHITVPKVLSVHNYRPFCSNGLLFRDGHVCLECPESGDRHAIVHGCYRGSRLATVPMAISRPSYRRNVLDSVDAIVTTSELSNRIFGDLSAHSLPTVMIPNFGPEEAAGPVEPASPRKWTTLGRFTAEKGFMELIQEWPATEQLEVVGDGPLADPVRCLAAEVGVRVTSSMPREKMREHLARAFALIFPSRWFESDPQIVVEAMRFGVPVVAFHANATAELVSVTGAGAIYGASEPLGTALKRVIANREDMSQAALRAYAKRWTKAAWLHSIEALYSRLLVTAD